MAYYTVAHMLQGGVLDGSGVSPEGIKPEDLTDDVWDFVFLNAAAPKKSKIPKKCLEKMRKEFRFWYPLDLRVSGKDLIQNHLTMSLYNHAAVWEKEPDLWPKGFFCNGWLMVNNEKMSKSKGNFFTLEEILKKFSADSVRLACANSGDTLEDANFEESVANKALLFMPILLETLKGVTSGSEPLEAGDENKRFVDRWFANEMNRLVVEAKMHYAKMYYREALRCCYFEFSSIFDQYRDICKACKCVPNKTLAMRYLEWQMITLSPICPHFCEHGWGLLGKKGTVLDARFPEPTKAPDSSIIRQGSYMFDKVPHDFIKLLEKVMTKSARPPSATVYIAKEFPAWKMTVLDLLRKRAAAGTLPLMPAEDMKNDDTAKVQWKEIMKDLTMDPSLKSVAKHVGPFTSFKRDEAVLVGVSAFDAAVPFDETALLTEHAQYLSAKLQMVVTVTMADKPKDGQADAAATAQPGQPSIHYDAAAGGAKAPAAKSGGGGGGGAKPAAAAKSSAPAAATIKDMGKLNEHLATRSYVEGGGQPTAGDAAQIDAMPATALDADKFPHVARWHRHISAFSPAQRGRW
jgi:leucyl-tRNA synthetase